MNSPQPPTGTGALVVGGYGGIGSVICEQLAERGTAIAVAGRSATKAAEFASLLRSRGATAIGLPVDITSSDSIRGALATAWSGLDGLDLLVNCAGRLSTAAAEDYDEAEWRAVVDANLVGPFLLFQEFGRRLIAAGRAGSIVQLSSVRSAAGSRRGFSAYAASKAGSNLLVKQLATEWARHGITVNAVAPGFVETDLVAAAAQDQKFIEAVRQRIPLGRFAQSAEVASAVVYLASPLARFVTGQVLFVDGGVTASQ